MSHILLQDLQQLQDAVIVSCVNADDRRDWNITKLIVFRKEKYFCSAFQWFNESIMLEVLLQIYHI